MHDNSTLSQFVATVETTLFGDPLLAWVTPLMIALMLTIVVIAIQQYQIAQLYKTISFNAKQFDEAIARQGDSAEKSAK